jgi:formate hydrogenlyase transcriptional activator
VVTIRDNKDLVQGIISTVNRITGAERGAIFLLEDHTNPPKLLLRASKTLTSDQIKHAGFASSMEMIEEVARAGKGRILGIGLQKKQEILDREIIRSRICVPMILRGTTVGVLYHDNRLLSSAFKESDLELLSYFAALAAFALDNARAYEEINRLNWNLNEENLYYKEEHLQNLHFEDIVGESPAIRSVFSQIDQVTETDATVMIIGETGVGKELVARAIHRNSPRRDKPFIRVHCSSLPESLIPSELFGHEKGAFTGAIRRRIGRFELADGGTLFLDEIGDLSLDIQVRLLRVLQTQEFERVGGSETLHSDFRLVVATNRNLEKEVKNEKFRADLYYRLAVFPIYVPPLRERNDDIPLLAHYFLKIYSKKRGKAFSGIPDMEMEKLLQYEWPGNVRELENIVERGTILNSGPLFKIPELRTEQHEASAPGGGVTLRDNERRHVLWALQKTAWKVRGTGGAAELLDIPPSTLAFRMKKLGIQRPAKSP